MKQLEKILPNIFNDVTNLSQVCEEFIKMLMKSQILDFYPFQRVI